MTYYGSKQMAASWRTVRGNTVQIAEDIPEDKYGFVVSDGTKTVAQTLAHMALMPGLAMKIHGEGGVSKLEDFDFMGVFGALQADEAKPRTKAELIELLKSEGEKFAAFLEAMPEEKLAEVVEGIMGQPSKTRFEMLLSPKEHEMHHRGQLMVVERLLGIEPHFTTRSQAFIKEYMEKMAAKAAS